MKSTATALTARLDRLRLGDAGSAGRKAATLGELSSAGLRVPAGFVLSADALETALRDAGYDQDRAADMTAAEVAKIGIPELVRHALTTALAELVGPDPAGSVLAVRSSGVEEDLAERSYAGQYKSLLGVAPAGIEQAVRACWASAFCAEARAYAERTYSGPAYAESTYAELAHAERAHAELAHAELAHAERAHAERAHAERAHAERAHAERAHAERAHAERGNGGALFRPAALPWLAAPPRLAVIVQRMVPAVAAGVAFSANPVSGDRGEAVVNAVRGLGARLAAGGQTPEEWSVRGEDAVRQHGPQQVLTAQNARLVAALARRAARFLGTPQDIEWALTQDGIHLLQSRPITALPPAPPEGFWLRGGYSLKPLSPMNVGTLLRAVNRGSPALFRYSLGQQIEVRSIGGWSYVRFTGLTEPAAATAKLRTIAAALHAGEPHRTVESWYARDQVALSDEFARMRATPLAELADPQLLQQIAERHRLAEQAQRLHFLAGGASSAEVGRLGVLCEEHLGWDVAKVLELLSGLPGKTTEPAVALDALVDQVAALPEPDALPGGLDEPLLDRIRAADPACWAALRGYLDEYGHRCMAADIAEPTLAERPEQLLRMVADRAAARTDCARDLTAVSRARQAAVAQARASLPPMTAAGFDQVLGAAEAAYPLRDDSAFVAHIAWGLLRYAVLELAARLVRGGRLVTASDVFLLSLDEATSALSAGLDPAPLVARRWEEVAWARAHRGPPTLGTPPAAGPALSAAIAEFPPRDQAVLAVLRWVETAYGIGKERIEQSGTTLRGVAASPGCHTARAKIIISVADFGKLCPGDVMVCPETTPQWAVLFGSVGALVTDTGGLLSHPAIIAREYGVPTVVATGNATRLIRDGQIVTVDGSAGLVTIEPDPETS